MVDTSQSAPRHSGDVAYASVSCTFPSNGGPHLPEAAEPDANTVGEIMEWIVVVVLVGGLYLYLRSRRTLPDLSMLPERFVVVDLETSGLDSEQHEIIEIGAVRVNRDSNVHDTFQVLVTPKRKISKKITQITNITQEMLDKDGQSLDSALSELVAFIGNHRIVAFNAEFDLAFLRKALAESGRALNNPSSCALKMARRAWPGRNSYRLVDLAKDGNLPVGGAHRALHDCRLTMTVFAAAAAKLRSVN
jgi:DNA polymerase III subunit epsilon